MHTFMFAGAIVVVDGGKMAIFSSSPVSVIKIIVLLVLSVATVVSFNLVDHYQVYGDELLENNAFVEQFERWKKNGSGITVSGDGRISVEIISSTGGKTVSISQTLENIKKGQPVRFSGVMKTRNVRRGDRVWKSARMIFVGIDRDGRPMFGMPHILATRNGSNDWESFSKVFVASSAAVRYYVEIQLVDVTGALWVRDLSLRAVKESPGYSLLRGAGIALWAAVALWVLVPHWRRLLSSKWNVLVMFMVIVALLGSLLSADLKHSVMDLVKGLLPWISDDSEVFLIGHFLVYSILSVAVFWKVPTGSQVASRFGLLLLFAMVTEVLQFLVDGRTPRVSDFAVDVSGIVLGLFVSRRLSPCKAGRKESTPCCCK